MCAFSGFVIIFSENFVELYAFVDESFVKNFPLVVRIKAEGYIRFDLNCAGFVELSANSAMSFDGRLHSIRCAARSFWDIEH